MIKNLILKILNKLIIFINNRLQIKKRPSSPADLYFEEVKAYSDPNRHPLGRVVTIAYYSFIKISDYKIHDSEDKHLEWIPINDIDELAFDHRLILDESSGGKTLPGSPEPSNRSFSDPSSLGAGGSIGWLKGLGDSSTMRTPVE